MISWWEAALLGLIQGFTEWLPISSSGHLVIFQNLLEIEDAVVFDLMLHIASFLVILWVFRADIIQIVKGIFAKEKEYIQFVIKLVMAATPVAIVGIFFENQVDAAFSNLLSVGISLIITGCLLLLSKYPHQKENDINYRHALIIGLFQAVSVFPGLSRSGSGMSGALIQGIKPKLSGRFVFLLAIPVIFGATIFKLDEISLTMEWTPIIVGMVVAFITGILGLKLLLQIIDHNRLWLFALYCIPLGFLIIIFSLI